MVKTRLMDNSGRLCYIRICNARFLSDPKVAFLSFLVVPHWSCNFSAKDHSRRRFGLRVFLGGLQVILGLGNFRDREFSVGCCRDLSRFSSAGLGRVPGVGIRRLLRFFCGTQGRTAAVGALALALLGSGAWF